MSNNNNMEGKQEKPRPISQKVGDDEGESDFASIVPSSSQHTYKKAQQDAAVVEPLTSRVVAAAASASASSMPPKQPRVASSSLSPSSSTAPIARHTGTLSQLPAAAAAAAVARAASPSSTQTRRNNNVVVMERENFLMFIKILFKVLEEAKEHETKSRAQRIVLECRRRFQQGDPNFDPMMEAVESRLRTFVGETKWRRAHLFLSHYMCKRQGGGMAAAAIRRTRPTAAC